MRERVYGAIGALLIMAFVSIFVNLPVQKFGMECGKWYGNVMYKCLSTGDVFTGEEAEIMSGVSGKLMKEFDMNYRCSLYTGLEKSMCWGDFNYFKRNFYSLKATTGEEKQSITATGDVIPSKNLTGL